MGYTAHDVVVAVTSDYRPGGLPDIDSFRGEMPESLRDLVIGPITTPMNMFRVYVFLPDGSKEGWPESNFGDEWRKKFRDLFRCDYGDGSSPDDVISVRFGGDFRQELGGARIMQEWLPVPGATYG